MGHFLTRYRITPEFYNELKTKVLTSRSVEAIKQFRDVAGVSLVDARVAILSEFKLEHKLSQDMLIYSCIQRIEQYEGINNLPVASDLGVILEFAREQLYNGLNCYGKK